MKTRQQCYNLNDDPRDNLKDGKRARAQWWWCNRWFGRRCRLSSRNLQFNSRKGRPANWRRMKRRREIGLSHGTARNAAQMERILDKKLYWFYNELISVGRDASKLSRSCPFNASTTSRLCYSIVNTFWSFYYSGFDIDRGKKLWIIFEVATLNRLLLKTKWCWNIWRY